MCEFCTKHGEGKKWYLVMRNYSRKLWEQKGRKEFAEYFWSQFEDYIKQISLVETFKPNYNRAGIQLISPEGLPTRSASKNQNT